jgi:hypothetical protein
VPAGGADPFLSRLDLVLTRPCCTLGEAVGAGKNSGRASHSGLGDPTVITALREVDGGGARP